MFCRRWFFILLVKWENTQRVSTVRLEKESLETCVLAKWDFLELIYFYFKIVDKSIVKFSFPPSRKDSLSISNIFGMHSYVIPKLSVPGIIHFNT